MVIQPWFCSHSRRKFKGFSKWYQNDKFFYENSKQGSLNEKVLMGELWCFQYELTNLWLKNLWSDDQAISLIYAIEVGLMYLIRPCLNPVYIMMFCDYMLLIMPNYDEVLDNWIRVIKVLMKGKSSQLSSSY